MRKTLSLLALAVLSLSPLSFEAGGRRLTTPQAQESGDREELMRLEQAWLDSTLRHDVKIEEQIEARDLVSVAPHGGIRYKDQEKADTEAGAFKAKSWVLDDMRVKVFGDTAVVTGRPVVTDGWFYDQSISGQYRFTHTWVKRDGNWQVVASQATPVVQRLCRIHSRRPPNAPRTTRTKPRF